MFYWIAYHLDNSQIDSRNKLYTYNDIRRNELSAFVLYSDKDNRAVVAVDFLDDVTNNNGNSNLGSKRLIYRKRTMVNTRSEQVSVHLVGWQRLVNGHNIQSICYVNEENETVVLGGQWVHGRQFMYPIQPLECEYDLVST